MELTRRRPARGRCATSSGEPVDVEPDFVYPLLKGADLPRPPAERARRAGAS